MIARVRRPGPMMVCSRCLETGEPTIIARGLILVGIVLCFMFLLPGILYFAWRSTTARLACPFCGGTELLRSRRARQLLVEQPREQGPG